MYYDCSTDDARLTLENALDAAKSGATVASWSKVVSFVKDGGRVTGVVVEDQLSKELRTVSARAIVNATGPWTDRTLAMSRTMSPLLRPTKGVHIVVPAEKLPVRNAVVCFHPTDGRVLFAIPWGEHTYVGTTDTDYDADPADVAATRADIDYLVAAAKAYFPAHPLTYADVVSTWAGLRPLMAPPTGGEVAESSVSREHQIVVGQDGIITIAGGKLTTYRRMAGEVVDTAVNFLRLQGQAPKTLVAANTESQPLPGGVGWPADDDHAAVAKQISAASGGKIGDDTALRLANTYGMLGLEVARRVAADPTAATRIVPGRPEILAQVDHAVDHEFAATITDFLLRRTQLYYRAPDQGLEGLAAVADRMGARLGWSADRKQAEMEAYRAEVARSRRWRDEADSH